jgi:hypothetical protein
MKGISTNVLIFTTLIAVTTVILLVHSKKIKEDLEKNW